MAKEIEKGVEKVDLSPIEELLKAQEARIDKIAGNKAVENFGEAFKLVGEVDGLIKSAERKFKSAYGSVETGNAIVELLQKVKEMGEEGKNDEAAKFFREESRKVVEKALLDRDMRVDEVVKIIGEVEAKELMFKLVPGMLDAHNAARRVGIKNMDQNFFKLFDRYLSDKTQYGEAISCLADTERTIALGGRMADENEYQDFDSSKMSDVAKYAYYLREVSF